MSKNGFSSEFERALARPDVAELQRSLNVHYRYSVDESSNRPEWSDECEDVIMSGLNDPDKAIAFVIIAAARYDDPGYLGLMSAGPLEDVLRNPDAGILERVVIEARRNARFRWMLSIPYPHAISADAAKLIYELVEHGYSDEAILPPRPLA